MTPIKANIYYNGKLVKVLNGAEYVISGDTVVITGTSNGCRKRVYLSITKYMVELEEC